MKEVGSPSVARLASLRVEDLTAVIQAQTRELKATNAALQREGAARDERTEAVGPPPSNRSRHAPGKALLLERPLGEDVGLAANVRDRDELGRGAGTQFDPRCVETFRAYLNESHAVLAAPDGATA